MLNELEALASFKQSYSSTTPKKIITFNGLFLIFAPRKGDPMEGDMDPYYSVDMNTGEARDYSIYRDGHAAEIVQMFVEAPLIERR